MDNQSFTLPVPAELRNRFFFEENCVNIEQPLELLSVNFFCEILFYNGIETFKPWENPVIAASFLKEEWGRVKDKLEDLFRIRDQKNSLQAMKKGIGLFLQLLFWSNDQPVVIKEPLLFNQVVFKPINLEERLEFVLSRPHLFHSFRQLSELMEEQEKLFVKKNIMKKASKPKG